MTETQRRIQAYKRALPHMKERVMAVALLFVISISMMVSASFAWITLSRSPEVNGLATTIATNGNLEIALSDIDGLAPDESAVGDGLGDITKTNLAWGNLINLSDPSYGLSDITLRPAALNTRTLLTNPMYAVSYGTDGRITDYFNDFAYATYDGEYNRFTVPDISSDEKGYGVRAISSVTYADYIGNAFIESQTKTITQTYNAARSELTAICNNMDYMAALAYLVEQYADVTLNGDGSDLACKADTVLTLADMIDDFYECMKSAGNAIVEIANLYQYLTLEDKSQYLPHTFDQLTAGTLATKYKNYTEFKKTADLFKTAWTKTNTAWKGISQEYDETGGDPTKTAVNSARELVALGETVYWEAHLAVPVDNLCKISTTTLAGKTVSQMKSNPTSALGALGDGSLAVINDGAIKDADQLLMERDEHINVYNPSVVKVKVKYIITVTIKPRIQTSAFGTEPYIGIAQTEAVMASEGGTGSKGQPVAAETYAMVIDFWVRTNSMSSLLILEGELKYEQDTGTDASGYSVGRLYYFENTNESGETVQTYVYKTDDGKMYYNNTSDEVPAEERPSDDQLVEAMKAKPSGYEGVNRVWDESDYDTLVPPIDSNSIVATQGSGSCYIFYPSSGEEQEQALRLLSNMRVAFVDEYGNLLATAAMDTSNAVEDAGRVLVPLLLRPNTPIEVDDDGNTESYYITPLVQNEATRITTLVYLDGQNLSNSDVLSAGTITGQLNIQFGTTDMSLSALKDEEVMRESYEFTFSPKSKEFSETDTEWKLPLELAVAGSKPNSVKGNFISVLTATQGARQPQFEMTYNESKNKWEVTVEFNGPGTYQLRSIQINGVDYPLNSDNIVTVKVPGTSVMSLRWDDLVDNPKVKSVLTAESSYQQSLSLTLKSNDAAAHKVYGIFMGDNGQNIRIDFAKGTGDVYSGIATFSASGKYTLSYIYVDEVPIPLSDPLAGSGGDTSTDKEKVLELRLGLSTVVNLMRPVLADDLDDNTILNNINGGIANGWSFTYTMGYPINIDVTCEVFDDQGNEITDFKDADLTYGTASVNGNLDVLNLTWDADRGKFVGTMRFQNSGIFSFKYLKVIDAKGYISYITSATVAPTITSIPPDEMEYVGKTNDHQELMMNLGSTDRKLSLVLKHAAAAMLDITVQRNNSDGSVDTVLFKNVLPENSGDYSTFTVNIVESDPNIAESGITQLDGKWTIIGAKASTVYYEGVFYGGGYNDDGSYKEDGWLDLTADSKWDSNISTEFITEYSVTIKNAPSNFGTVAFATDNICNNMQFIVSDYAGRALSMNGNDLDISIELWYKCSVGTGVTVETTDVKEVGGIAVNDSSDKTILTMPEMNFFVHGTYSAVAKKITIKNGDEVIVNAADLNINIPSVKVNWRTPSVTISSITPNGSHTTINKNDSDKTVESKIDGNTAVVFCEYSKSGNGKITTYPSVTLLISNVDAAEKAEMQFTGDTDYIYTGTDSSGQTQYYVWNQGEKECTRYIGNYKKSNSCRSMTANPAGTLKSSSLKLEYSGVSYTFAVNEIIIKNEKPS